MGTTRASLHVLGDPDPGDVGWLAAVEKGYAALGHRVVTEGSERVVRLARLGAGRFVSIEDDANRLLDSGDLKQLGLILSRVKGGVSVVASVEDSDRFDWVVYAGGKQVDVVGTAGELRADALVALSPRSRAKKWSQWFGTIVDGPQLAAVLAKPRTFAEDALADLAALVGLDPAAPVADLVEDGAGRVLGELTLARDATSAAAAAARGQAVLEFLPLLDDFPYHGVQPAAWPLPAAAPRGCEWSVLSRGAAIDRLRVTVSLAGDHSFRVLHATLGAFKFYNGQIVGAVGARPPAEGPWRIAVDPGAKGPHVFDFAGLGIPERAPAGTTEILILLAVAIQGERGETSITARLEPALALPEVRFAAIEPTWIPLVSGAHPAHPHHTADLSPTHRVEAERVRDEARLRAVPLNHPGVAQSVSILARREGQTLPALRALVEEWVRRFPAAGTWHVRTEKRMTPSGSVTKKRQDVPAVELLASKVWPSLFSESGRFQTVLVHFTPEGWDHPCAGFGIQLTLEAFSAAHEEALVARTLEAMRGRPAGELPRGETIHLYRWGVDRSAAAADPDWNDVLSQGPDLLQGWTGAYGRIPLFDRADGYETTVYESASTLNWFRGILPGDGGIHSLKMRGDWCARVLRFVAPEMWLGPPLAAGLDMAEVEKVAEVAPTGTVCRLRLRAGRRLDELERVLLDILPVDATRVLR